jgi:hypothetical protein
MGRVKLYRRSATECLALADLVSNAGDRAMLVAMAARWHDLAQRADRNSVPEGEGKPQLERRARFRLVSASHAPAMPRDR